MPSLTPKNPFQNPVVVTCAYDPRSGDTDTQGSLGLLANQPTLTGEPQVPGETLSQNLRWTALKKQDPGLPHICI